MDAGQKRLIKAFLVAPLVGPALFAIGVTVFGAVVSLGSGGLKQAGIVLTGAPIWFLFGVPVSYVITILFGLPAYYLFRSRLSKRLGSWVLAAAIVGVVAGVIIALVLRQTHPGWYLGYMLFGSVFGAATGHAFWRLAIKPPNTSLQSTTESGD